MIYMGGKPAPIAMVKYGLGDVWKLPVTRI